MDINAEKKYFSEALCFFHETQWLHNISVTEILTTEVLNAIPKEWIKHLEILENEELNSFVVDKVIKSDWSDSLKTFVVRCKKMNRLPLTPALSSIELPHNFRIGLNQKKQHEIMHLARLVNAQCKQYDIQTIIDLGAGLGYVCQMLHYLYGYRVLGLERNKENIDRAFTRQKKLYPNSLTEVKYAHCNVTYDSANIVESILQQEFPNVTDVCLIGLHACGDLSTDASKVFCKMKSAKLFILISCCYHKLSISESMQTPLQEKQYFHNFPTSNCLRQATTTYNYDVGEFLRIPFLRLACQESADKWHGMSREKHNDHSFHVLARAVLQLYSRQNNYVLRKKVRKGTRKSQCLNFETYIKDSLLRYDFVPNPEEIGNSITHDKMKENLIRIWKEHSKSLKTIEIYTGLQMMLQLPAESLILQDRLCWLHEQGLEAVIVPVMNKCISPRSYAIVSHKR